MNNSYTNTKQLLSDYRKYKAGIEIKRQYSELYITNCDDVAEKYIKLIDTAIERLSHEEDITIIDMYYRQGETMETIAEKMNISINNAYKGKKRLIHKLRFYLFPDDRIQEFVHGAAKNGQK